MLLQTLQTRLEKSNEFKKFKSENPEAFLCAGFFIINLKGNIFEYSLDFRNDKQIFTFKIPENEKSGIIMLQDEILDKTKPLEKINLDVQIDIEDLREIIEKNLELNNIKNRLEEFIAVLQNLNNQIVWNLTVMLEGFTIINIIINSETGNIEKFEKKNLMDFIKKP
jgi:hypothetical protein